MAGMTTTLTETFTQSGGNSRTYAQPGHTALTPKLVLQRSKSAGAGGVAEDTISCLQQTEDDDGIPLSSKVMFSATVRRPVDGQAADVTAQLAVFRDIVASDEFTAMVTDQLPVA